ncbi:Transposase IS66 family protein [Pseudomonas salomonii]|uniref:Transposase IS66 family protein n=1 Tax=Pseudomonas salomonii TaxID=191391 RepID=A0A1H3C8X1_9PSED|nr:Transposase IS66 family protein [Pseudomonas salomonii]
MKFGVERAYGSDAARITLAGFDIGVGHHASGVAHTTQLSSGISGRRYASVAGRNTLTGSGISGDHYASGAAHTTQTRFGISGRRYASVAACNTPTGSGISKAFDYSPKRCAALSRYSDYGAVPIDNNWAENQIRRWAL